MKILDLYAGLRGWSDPFKQRGHEVLTLDIDPQFEADYRMSILDFDPSMLPWRPDVILASPPCEAFSVASIGTHWTGGHRAYEPRTPHAEQSKLYVLKTLELIGQMAPKVAVIENPRGVLRKLGLIPVDPTTVWYCRYGEEVAKPTDLWGLPFPSAWVPRPQCHNNRDHPATCSCNDHHRARRGAKTGTQGRDGAARRAEIPRELALSICYAAEDSLKPARRIKPWQAEGSLASTTMTPATRARVLRNRRDFEARQANIERWGSQGGTAGDE